MKRVASLAVAAAAASAIALSARDASALGGEIGGDIGYGLQPFGDPSGAINRYGFGVGGHGGIEISHVYLGASIRYYIGGSLPIPATPFTPATNISTSTLQFGGEIGYQISILILTLRPYVWAGPTMYLQSSDNPAIQAQNSTRFSLAPGLFARLKVAGPFFLGADVRYSIVLGGNGEDPNTQLSFMGSLGLAF